MRIQSLLSLSSLPQAEKEILLAAALSKNRSWILSHGDHELNDREEQQWNKWEARRKNHEPIAYIIGKREFYGRTFKVDTRVLIPRPATEGLIEATLAWLEKPMDVVREIDSHICSYSKVLREGSANTAVDIGTGSGCIAVTLALERPDLRIIATDCNEEALAVARSNAQALGADHIHFEAGDLLDPASSLDEPFLLVSNPPYIPDGRKLMADVANFEPHGALFAGPDGMDVIQPLLIAAKNHPQCHGVILECEDAQIPLIEKILAE